jgi:uncharacterized GH25 family protein
MIQRKLLTLFTLFTLYTLLSAHEFWLDPDKFIYKRTEKVNIRFLVGENFDGENWQGNNGRIKSLKLYYDGVNDDLTPVVTEEEGDSIEYFMIDEGTNLIAFNSNNSFINLEPGAFNEYLEEDGLSDALEYRKKNNEMGCNGREFYQRCAKTLLQVGEVKDQTFGITTSMPIDIIPSSNPYQLKNKERLRVKVYYKGSPLPNTLIRTWHRVKNKTEKKDLKTDGKGEIVFPVSTTGKWMISTVKMERLLDNPICDWQSYWGSLTWGYE